MLLTVVAERSQRKLRPSLAGTTISMIRVTRVRTGGRIPIGHCRAPAIQAFAQLTL
jgi:hypothetical protein